MLNKILSHFYSENSSLKNQITKINYLQKNTIDVCKCTTNGEFSSCLSENGPLTIDLTKS